MLKRDQLFGWLDTNNYELKKKRLTRQMKRMSEGTFDDLGKFDEIVRESA